MGKLIFMVLSLFWSTSFASECPSVPEVQSILNRVLEFPVVVKSVSSLKPFNACRVETASGDTFFLSQDRRFLIEGVLLKVPPLKVSKREFDFFKEKALFSVGRGRELLVFTNPMCKACRENGELLKELERKFKVYFVPLGFNREEFEAAVASYCEKAVGRKFFSLKPPFKLCSSGKLKVWSVEDKFKKMGITGTPVFITDEGNVIVGVDGLKRFLSHN